MSKFYFDDGVSPGVLSALLFIIMDILIIGLLDVVLTRVVCIVYFRNVNNGQPILVKSADIPGLTHFLIGSPLSLVNMAAVLCKIALLVIIFIGNIDISDDAKKPVNDFRDATFDIRPNDTVLADPSKDYAVRRRFDRSKFCINRYQGSAVLDYYPIRFNLSDGVVLQDDAEIDVNDANAKRYDIDDETVICMSPIQTKNEKTLQRVLGCTHLDDLDDLDSSRCKSVVSQNISRPGSFNWVNEPRTTGRLVSELYRYSDEDVNTIFEDPYLSFTKRFTCLATKIDDGDSTVPYEHCLLVAFNETTTNDPQTIVERWVVEQFEGQRRFVLPFRGIIFEGIFDLSENAAVNYLENLYIESDYESMSGDLIAVSSIYRSFSTGDKLFVRYDRKNNSEEAYATISKWVVWLLVSAIVIVLVALVVTTILLRFDKRPRFNTINGLSSIVREEYAPSGKSYTDDGKKKAILGLRFTKDDRIHFGPIEDFSEAQKMPEGYDVS